MALLDRRGPSGSWEWTPEVSVDGEAEEDESQERRGHPARRESSEEGAELQEAGQTIQKIVSTAGTARKTSKASPVTGEGQGGIGEGQRPDTSGTQTSGAFGRRESRPRRAS